jgi:hypothetical protein
MTFGLINAGVTFHRAMCIAFRGLLGECVVVYFDDVTIFSRDRNAHIIHLKKIFHMCKRYGISLNPKKSVFVVDEDKLPGFIVSKHGMKIELERTESIAKIPPHHNKKSMQSFLGRINFVRRFIRSFAETIKPMQDMIKKNVEFRWGSKEKEYFNKIKANITQAPALLILDFNQEFILYTFSFDITFVAVLT